jgi:hypothetical protein
MELSPCIISDHSGIKLDLKKKRIPGKYSNTWKLNNTLLINQWVTKVIREEFKFLESNENENTTYQKSVGHSKGCAKGKAYSYKCLH